MAKFQAAGIQPFGVNPAGVEAHASYVKKMRFNFPLLSDPDRAIARAYHALKDDDRGIARTVYVVGKDGTVRFGQRGAPAVDGKVALVTGVGQAGQIGAAIARALGDAGAKVVVAARNRSTLEARVTELEAS